MNETNIRWTDYTWNPVHGCSKVSEGCQNCYAERVSNRHGHTDHRWLPTNALDNVQIKPDKLSERPPDAGWVFVNSMSDLYHPLVEDEFIEQVHEKIGHHPALAFQVLTKHGASNGRDIPAAPDNLMLGVSVESERRLSRIDWLRSQQAETKFISFEPLVEGIAPPIDLEGIDWAIVGGESHPDADERREMDPGWARNIIRECRREDVAVFFKQHSGPRPESDITIDMGDGEERIEEFPELPEGIVPAPKEFLVAADGGVR